ncbi:MAG: nitrophenyl compound nitroreductase subunit ArsF family protein [Planctomycetaceae bacterium]|jgi:hypothetical protein|nr:nitrophenyl compound nitroreductase subunit ArsF family protein [Planctomycetaceae bacterium]
MKRLLFWFLLVFVLSAVLTQTAFLFRNHETVEIPDGFNVIVCHARIRCPACLKMESLVRQTLEEEEIDSVKRFRLMTLEYDIPANNAFAKRFHVGTATVLLVEQKNGKTVRFRDLTTNVWNHLNNDTAFVTMLKNELKK